MTGVRKRTSWPEPDTAESRNQFAAAGASCAERSERPVGRSPRCRPKITMMSPVFDVSGVLVSSEVSGGVNSLRRCCDQCPYPMHSIKPYFSTPVRIAAITGKGPVLGSSRSRPTNARRASNGCALAIPTRWRSSKSPTSEGIHPTSFGPEVCSGVLIISSPVVHGRAHIAD